MLLINDATEVYNCGCYGTSHAIREQPLVKALKLCNYVVVNGEGSIHDFRNGPRALLYIMYAAKTWYAKPVSSKLVIEKILGKTCVHAFGLKINWNSTKRWQMSII